MKAGDILVIPGFPGHTVIVADVIRKENRLKIAVIEEKIQLKKQIKMEQYDEQCYEQEGKKTGKEEMPL